MRRGFSLLEALVYVSLFSLISGICLAIFSYGVRDFQLSTRRADLRSELRRVLASLRRDVQNSSFLTFDCVPRTYECTRMNITTPVQRDALSLGTVLPATPAQGVDPATGQMLWNGYFLYFATAENPQGKLVRALVENPQLPSVVGCPLEDFRQGQVDYLKVPPGRGAVAGECKTLTDSLIALEFELDEPNQSLGVKLTLASGPTETLEANLSFQSDNTWPKS